MTEQELEELLADCPVLFHMAEQGSWSSIHDRGLLSTTALLDLYGVAGRRRQQIEGERRHAGVALEHSELPRAVIRDQIPMDDAGLKRCLPSHLKPSDWYRLLNSKVFFWLTRDRLLRLLNAGAYRSESHDVIEVDARRLLKAHFERIWFCPMNSGCTKPMPHPRDERTFLRIAEYPYSAWRSKRPRGERVVELAVDYSVPNIRDFVLRVTEMRGSAENRVICRS